MLERENLLEDIRKGLAVLQNYIRPGGTLNLTDTNVHSEDFAGTEALRWPGSPARRNHKAAQ